MRSKTLSLKSDSLINAVLVNAECRSENEDYNKLYKRCQKAFKSEKGGIRLNDYELELMSYCLENDDMLTDNEKLLKDIISQHYNN